MPTYEYTCKACGEHLEVVQSFKDDSLTECPACGGTLRKVFGNIGIAFKGTGFYRTDSRSENRSSTSKGGEPTAEGSKAEGGKADASKAEGSKSEGAKAEGSKASDSSASSSGSSSSVPPPSPGSGSSGSGSSSSVAAAS